MSTLPQAIIFDLDDTILDDSGSMQACWDDACLLGASHLVGIDAETLMAAVFRHRDWFWSDPARHREGRLDLRAASRGIVRRALADLGCDRPQVAHEIADNYRTLREERLCLVPGAIETLEHFRNQGVRLGMATNGSTAGQGAKIERFGLAGYFDRIIIEGEYGVGKPHREVYEALLSSLNASPAETWSVGDNLEWDVGGPQLLGVYGVWVDVAGSGLPAGLPVKPDRIVRSIRELITSGPD